MRLTILGGSAASPNDGAGCSGYLIEAGATRIMLDPGPGTLQELRKHADFRALSAVLVSHMHLDHVLDLLALRHALAYNPIAAANPTPVWLPPGGAAFFNRVCAPFDEHDDPGRFSRTVDVREYSPGTILEIGAIAITFAPAVHYVPAWAMRFAAPGGGDLGYTADTGPTADLDGLFANVAVLLAEATLLTPGDEPTERRGSLTAEEAGSLASRVCAGRLVLTHVWQERGQEAAFLQARRTFAGPIEIARPGLRIET